MAALGVAAFAPSVRHGFIYDDYWTVLGNRGLAGSLRQLLRDALSGQSVVHGMPDATRPALGVSLWLDQAAFGRYLFQVQQGLMDRALRRGHIRLSL